jgi:hypothetical protein
VRNFLSERYYTLRSFTRLHGKGARPRTNFYRKRSEFGTKHRNHVIRRDYTRQMIVIVDHWQCE